MPRGFCAVGRDHVVEIEARIIDAAAGREMREASLGAGVARVLGVLLARLGRGAPDDHRHAHEDPQVRRITPGLGRLAAQLGHQLARAGAAAARHERAFGMARRELLAAPRGARLEQHRRALRRGFGEVVAVDLVEAAAMADAVHLGRIGEHARLAVAAHRAVLPAAFPQLVGHFQVLVGAVVAFVVLDLAGQAHRARRAVEVARHDVPADPAAAQVVERREAPGQQVGRLVGQVHGDAEAEVPGGGGHRRDQHHRVVDGQLDRLAQRQVERLAIDVVDADDIGDEQPVEQAAFEQAGEVGPVGERAVVGGTIAWMRPQTMVDVADAVHVERVQADRLSCHRRGARPGGLVETS